MVTPSAAASPTMDTSATKGRKNKTYQDMIIEAVATLKKRDGSTKAAIRNFMKKEHLPSGTKKSSFDDAMTKLLKEDKLKAVELKSDKLQPRYKLTDSAKKELNPKSECAFLVETRF